MTDTHTTPTPEPAEDPAVELERLTLENKRLADELDERGILVEKLDNVPLSVIAAALFPTPERRLVFDLACARASAVLLAEADTANPPRNRAERRRAERGRR